MKNMYCQLQERLIRPLKEWLRRLTNKQDDDDNPFNHPWAIF